MQRLEVSCAVRRFFKSLDLKGLIKLSLRRKQNYTNNEYKIWKEIIFHLIYSLDEFTSILPYLTITL